MVARLEPQRQSYDINALTYWLFSGLSFSLFATNVLDTGTGVATRQEGKGRRYCDRVDACTLALPSEFITIAIFIRTTV